MKDNIEEIIFVLHILFPSPYASQINPSAEYHYICSDTIRVLACLSCCLQDPPTREIEFPLLH